MYTCFAYVHPTNSDRWVSKGHIVLVGGVGAAPERSDALEDSMFSIPPSGLYSCIVRIVFIFTFSKRLYGWEKATGKKATDGRTQTAGRVGVKDWAGGRKDWAGVECVHAWEKQYINLCLKPSSCRSKKHKNGKPQTYVPQCAPEGPRRPVIRNPTISTLIAYTHTHTHTYKHAFPICLRKRQAHAHTHTHTHTLTHTLTHTNIYVPIGDHINIFGLIIMALMGTRMWISLRPQHTGLTEHSAWCKCLLWTCCRLMCMLREILVKLKRSRII